MTSLAVQFARHQRHAFSAAASKFSAASTSSIVAGATSSTSFASTTPTVASATRAFSTAINNLPRSSRTNAALSRHISTNSPSKQAAAAAAAQTATSVRPEPSPAFQQSPRTIAPLTSRYDANTLDESFVGMSGGAIFHEMMLRHDVKHVFGYPGGAILPVFDAIYNSKHFDFVLPRREDGAGHMAEGYARVTGKPGVILVTSGPGATNVITPMQDAMSDGTPLVVFCGQVATSAIGSDAFQEADVVGISRSCTKWNVMVKDIAELPRRINEAFKIATSGRPGPVLVDLPKDVTAGILRQAIPYSQTQPNMITNLPSRQVARNRRGASFQHSANMRSSEQDVLTSELQEAARLITIAKRPIIYAGQGILSSPDGPRLLAKLAKEHNIPVTTTLQGLGAFDELDPLSLHMLGMHGSAYANLAMQDADLIIALGARFDDRVTGRVDKFAPHARAAALENRGGIIHFEVMPKNINKVVQATCAIEGDVVANLGKLMPYIQGKGQSRTEWHDLIKTWKDAYPFTFEPSKEGELMKPQEVIEALDAQVADQKDNVIISTGVGQHQMWAAQHYRWRHPRTWVSSGGLGTMGFGLPSCIGAKVAAPEKIVVDIDGDASFSMTAMELATAAQYNIGVKVLVLNNEFQGMVVQWQDLFYEKRYSHTEMHNPDFVKLAESMGVKAIRCDSIKDLPAKMKEFIEYDNNKPILFEARITKNEHVYPFCPASAGLHELIVHPSLKPIPKRS
ncbi:probable acetolactate synthase [Melanopsichium pennsylvanicum]|uniref:Acetolactate synthase n=2 Tax=Melanopsichium pennsylvanicum TaxID=63383 RepID=A0AAJ5C5R2_9BASI|nr:probable acetolactate synthase [Melanopsichium pennsylvanicum 4]SNX85006.1 probable acetolactate synthase [Melanopsichium pennsylvanicum]